MGCGKSSVGAVLKDRYGLALADLDSLIEKNMGQTIPEIFSSQGEEGFREIEYRCLADLISHHRSTSPTLILSLGGGTLTYPPSRELVGRHTTRIYLRARVDTLVRNLEGSEDGRPMLRGEGSLREKVASLLRERKAVYEEGPVTILDTDGLTAEETARRVVQLTGTKDCLEGGGGA